MGPAFERTVIDHLLEGADGGDRADRAPEIGLFRHALIRPVADPDADWAAVRAERMFIMRTDGQQVIGMLGGMSWESSAHKQATPPYGSRARHLMTSTRPRRRAQRPFRRSWGWANSGGLEAPVEHGDSHSRVERMTSRPRASAHRHIRLSVGHEP